jgi:hypothetical protein
MKELFLEGKITEVRLSSDIHKDVKITMLDNKCFLIRQFNVTLMFWQVCYETSSDCEWDKVLNLAKSLIK